MSRYSLTWRGQELNGWRWWFALAVGALITLVVAVVGIALALVSLPLALVVRVLTGKWPTWYKVTYTDEPK